MLASGRKGNGMSDTRNVPPEITAEELFVVPIYICLCGQTFATYSAFQAHFTDECPGQEPKADDTEDEQ